MLAMNDELAKMREHAMDIARQKFGDDWLTAPPPSEALEPPPLVGTCYVVQVQPQRESMASGGLIGKGFPAYCPYEPKSVRANYLQRRTVMRPMLPGYVFTSFDLRERRWPRIFTIPGVIRLLMLQDRPVPVPEPAIHRIKQQEASKALGPKRKHAPLPVQEGDWVQIMAGSFTGFFGRVAVLVEPKARIVVGVDLFGRQTPVEVSVNQVQVV